MCLQDRHYFIQHYYYHDHFFHPNDLLLLNTAQGEAPEELILYITRSYIEFLTLHIVTSDLTC